MEKHILFWWTILCAQLSGWAVFALSGLFMVMFYSDPSYITSLVLLLYAVTTVFIGYQTHKARNESVDPEIGWFASEVFLTLGMLGTVIGFLIMLSGVFLPGLNFSDIKQLQDLLGKMSLGMSAALWTTVIGMICSLLTKVQMFNLEKLTNEKSQ